MVPLDCARKTAALRPANYFNQIAVSKLVYQDLVADICGIRALVQTKLFQNSRGRGAASSLLEVTAHRLCHILQLERLLIDQAQLDCVIAVWTGGGLLLHNDARTRLNNRHGRNRAVRSENLRHANFSTDDSVNHDSISDCRLPIADWYFQFANRILRMNRTAQSQSEIGNWQLAIRYCLPNALISTSTPAGRSSF